LLPPAHGRAVWVGEGYVFPMGEHHLVGLRVSFNKLGYREAILFEHFVDIIYGRHL
jgi:hypothetical protein